MLNNKPNKTKFHFQPINLIILIVLLAVVIVLGYISFNTKKTQDAENTAIHRNTLFKSDVNYDAVQKDKNALDSMINSINTYKPNDVNSVVGIIEEVYGFRNLIESAKFLSHKYSSDAVFTDKTNKMLDMMKQKQNHYFPIFRSSYSRIANRLMNAEGISSFVSGVNNNTLEFIGDRYLDSANIKIDFDILFSHLELLRYKQVVFRVKNDSMIVKSYNINSANDDVIL